jgi:hypothetical protein
MTEIYSTLRKNARIELILTAEQQALALHLIGNKLKARAQKRSRCLKKKWNSKPVVTAAKSGIKLDTFAKKKVYRD